MKQGIVVLGHGSRASVGQAKCQKCLTARCTSDPLEKNAGHLPIIADRPPNDRGHCWSPTRLKGVQRCGQFDGRPRSRQ